MDAAANSDAENTVTAVHTSSRKGLANSVLGTRNLMTVAALSVVGLIILTPLNYVVPLLGASPKAVLIGCSLMGFWVIPYLLPSTIVRRPGATMLAALIIGVVSIFITPSGPSAVIGNLIGGLFVELPLAIMRYRKWTNWAFILSAGVFGFLNGFLYMTLLNKAAGIAAGFAVLAVSIVSALLGGLITVGITHLLNKAGVGVANRA